MGDANKMLEEQQKELERIRAKRRRGVDSDKLRKVLNIIFLVFAIIGFSFYFIKGYRDTGIVIIVIGMVVKILEFFIRFMM